MELKPENIMIRVKSAEKRTCKDHWGQGQDPDTERTKDLGFMGNYPDLVSVFVDIVKDPDIKPEQIGIMDPNIYCDTKGGGFRVVDDNTSKGCFRAMYDRMENSRGRKPSQQEEADFKAEKIELTAATYEVYFTVCVVGFDEADLAAFLGVNNW